MLSAKEIAIIILMSIILGASISLFNSYSIVLTTILVTFLVVAINVLVKKFAAYYYESEIEVKTWEVSRFGYKAHQHFKNPVPTGILVPIVVSIFTLGRAFWLAALTFDIKAKVSRSARRHGLYSFSEMTEDHIGFIAAAGVVANLVFAIIGYLLGFSEFARINIWFAFFNMLPLSDLDGNKIFFGSIILWSFLAALTLIAVGYAIMIV